MRYIKSINYSSILIATYCIFILLSISQKGWIYEDAFITFRTITNFLDGYGLRWNIDERVQTYTHPLWMLLHIPFYAISKNIFFVSLGLSIVLSVLACLISLNHLKSKLSLISLGTCFVTPLLLSKTFGLFATSGFECPLVFFLFSLFCIYYFSKSRNTHWLSITFIIALCATTRLDTIIIFLPALIYLILSHRKKLPYSKIIIGFSPLILWEIFSIVYYGSLFPNTKYAKLNSDLPTLNYLKQGWYYLLDCIQLDLITSFIIFLGFIITSIWIYKWYRDRENKQAIKCSLIGIGLCLYSSYVIRIGGDHTSLRLWAIPFYTTLVYINYSIYFTSKESSKVSSQLSTCLALVFCIHYTISPVYYRKNVKHGISNTHYNSGQTVSYPLSLIKNNAIDYHIWVDAAKKLNSEVKKLNKPIFKRVGGIGIQGFYSDPLVILSDSPSLSDPLTARLPATSRKNWRIGHLIRALPTGYVQARMHGDYSHMDPDLATYYQKIRIITSGRIFSFNRLKTIVLFNFGYYEKYRQKYINKQKYAKWE